MSFTDVLFPIVSQPDATPADSVEAGLSMIRMISPSPGEVTALILQARYPAMHNPMANTLIQLDAMARDQEVGSAAHAKVLEKTFRGFADAADLAYQVEVHSVPPSGQADFVADKALTRDVTVIPVGPSMGSDEWIAEAVLFGSGRPVVLFPERLKAQDLERTTVAIAWDGSKTAARAVADAMPLLRRARAVRVLVVLDEKPAVVSGGARALLRHLRIQGIDATVDERPSQGEQIGQVVRSYIEGEGIGLLVMGGYGHSRLREFILGGATSDILRDPPCPVLLSH